MILFWYLHSLSEDKALVGAASGSIAWMAGFTFCRKFIYIFVGANGDFPSIVKFNNYFHVISPAGRYQVCFDSCRPVSCKSLVVDFFVMFVGFLFMLVKLFLLLKTASRSRYLKKRTMMSLCREPCGGPKRCETLMEYRSRVTSECRCWQYLEQVGQYLHCIAQEFQKRTLGHWIFNLTFLYCFTVCSLLLYFFNELE